MSLDRSFKIGCGIQSVKSLGARPIVKPTSSMDNLISKSSVPENKFRFDVNFYNSSAEMQKALSYELNAAASLNNINAEIQTVFGKVTSNNNSHSYCLFTLQKDVYKKNLIMSDLTKFIDMNEELKDLEKFYRSYGDGVITEATYGEKLIVVIRVSKARQSRAFKWALGSNFKAPYALSGGVDVAKLLTTTDESDNANLHIYSIGNDSPNQQISVIDDLKKIKDKLESLWIKNNSQSAITLDNTMQESTQIKQLLNLFMNTYAAQAQHTSTAAAPVEAKPSELLPELKSINESIKNLTDKMKSAESPLARLRNTTDTLSERAPVADKNDGYSIVSYTKSSYAHLITNKETEERFNKLMESTTKVNNYLHAIATCHSRAQLYLDHIDYAFKLDGGAINLNNKQRKAIEDHKEFLKRKIIPNLGILSADIIKHMFKEEFVDSDNNVSSWEDKWQEILSYEHSINNLHNEHINYRNSSFLLKKILIDTTPPTVSCFGLFSRVSEYFSFCMPYDTDKLYFKFSTEEENNKGPLTQEETSKKAQLDAYLETLICQLVRKHSINLHGISTTKKKHVLHEKIMDGSKADPLYHNFSEKGFRNFQALENFLSDKYSRKVYKNAAFKHLKSEAPCPEFLKQLTVSIFAQTATAEAPLALPRKPPHVFVNHEPYSFPIDGVLQHSATSQSQNAFFGSPIATNKPRNQLGFRKTNFADSSLSLFHQDRLETHLPLPAMSHEPEEQKSAQP